MTVSQERDSVAPKGADAAESVCCSEMVYVFICFDWSVESKLSEITHWGEMHSFALAHASCFGFGIG